MSSWNSKSKPMLPKSSRLARRRFLQCAGATAAALPFLRTLPSYAQADAVPKLILGFSGNGRIRHLWGGQDTGGGLMLRQNLAPLQPWAQYITIAENLYNPDASAIGGTHEGGTKTLFTGGGGSTDNTSAGAGGPSIDTLFMAQQSGTPKNTSFYQQVVAERNSAESAGPNNRLVFDSTGAAREPYRSGWEAVDGYLNGLISQPSDQPPMTGPSTEDIARTKLFETLNKQLGDLESRLCSEDYYQMGAMREAVAKASSSMQLVVDCEIPELPAKPDLPDYEPIWQPPQRNIDLKSNSDWYYLRGHLATDLLVMSLSCGVTRAGVLQFDQAAGEAQATGHPATHHNQSHETPTSLQPFLVAHNWVSEEDPFYYVDYQHEPPDAVRTQYQTSWDLLSEWELYYADQFAYLLQQLEAFGLLADTAVLWGSEIDLGGAHNHMSMPSLLISGEKLPFARGKSVMYPADYTGVADVRSSIAPAGTVRKHNDLLRTVLNGLGVDVTSVGNPSSNGGVLTEVLPG